MLNTPTCPCGVAGLGTGIFIRDNPNLNGAQLPAALFNNIMLGSLGILHNPNLNTLPSDLFQGLQMAANSTLYLQGNGLTFLPPDLFEGLPLSYVRHVTLFDNNFSRASNFPSFGSGIYIGACESGVLNSDVITSTDEFGTYVCRCVCMPLSQFAACICGCGCLYVHVYVSVRVSVRVDGRACSDPHMHARNLNALSDTG